jgi:hypothetical protein
MQKTLFLKIFLLVFFSTVGMISYLPENVIAQSINCQTGSNAFRRAEGLISTPALSDTQSIFYNYVNGIYQPCVINTPKATYVPLKIPTYAELKLKFFDKVKDHSQDSNVYRNKVPLTSNASSPYTNPSNNLTGLGTLSLDTVTVTPGDLNITSTGFVGPTTNIISQNNLLVFVEGDLNIKADMVNNNPTTGLVLVVKGNININKSVKRIDAFLISQGKICTASETAGAVEVCPTNKLNPLQTIPLRINGGLVSLNQTSENPVSGGPPTNPNINFRRWAASDTDPSADPLNPNAPPGEIVTQDPRYMVAMTNLFAEPLDITTEDTSYSIGLLPIPIDFSYSIDARSNVTMPRESFYTLDFLAKGPLTGSFPSTAVSFNVQLYYKSNNQPVPTSVIDLKTVPFNSNTYICTFSSTPSGRNCRISFKITTFSSTPLGNLYYVKVTSPPVDPQQFDLNIIDKISVNVSSIPATSPVNVAANKNASVTWSFSITPTTDRLAIFNKATSSYVTNTGANLYLNNPACTTTAPGAPVQSGTCTYLIPKSTTPGDNYVIRLTNADRSFVMAESNTFTISEFSQIFITSPSTCSVSSLPNCPPLTSIKAGDPIRLVWRNILGATYKSSLNLFSIDNNNVAPAITTPTTAWVWKVYPVSTTSCSDTTPTSGTFPSYGYCDLNIPNYPTTPSDLIPGLYTLKLILDDNYLSPSPNNLTAEDLLSITQ